MVFNMAQRAAAEVQTRTRTSDDTIDFLKYVHIECIPGGSNHDCEWVDGVVTHVATHKEHTKMDHDVANPRILLLKCALEYERRENAMAEFESLEKGQRTYLKILVQRILEVRIAWLAL
jgi:1-phosphatidylinositol-3-phosphate 5-kinase